MLPLRWRNGRQKFCRPEGLRNDDNEKNPNCITAFHAVVGCENINYATAVQGGDLTVTPITYTFTVTMKNKTLGVAKKELFAYLKENKDSLLVYGADISWSGKKGQLLAQEASKWLLSAGSPSELVIEGDNALLTGSAVSITTTVHQVQTRLCNLRVIGHYHSGDDGCYSENLRWHAMVHPERKLAGQAKTTLLTPKNP
ncbi:hypothetical protein [Enterovibrio nigricans]|uniref:Uncharacterized protein n=1 Tax=Enterovibrio nigricans DSM 22720 TaxID=1121868 RepID=A0A1T4VVK7_9GAMM|nr:hypothetical protein [Enterovibrio nigricans]SKA69023.1 hypothetical protein SAMN02745132_04393 [Enterovibrio nigricans DSM 22720]